MKAISWSWVGGVLLPACSIYGEGLLLDGDASPGGDRGDDAGSGGAPLSMGGESSGGSDSSSGGAPSGGAPSGGAATGGQGTGGNEPTCKGTFDDVAETSLIDDFDDPSRQLGDGDYRGIWASYGNGTDLAPSQTSTWTYGQDPCFEDGDTSLHVTATGYTSWAHFLLDLEENADLSSYDGLIFWGRTETSPRNSVRFQVRNLSSEQTQSTYETLSDDEWRQVKIPFAAGVTRSEVSELKLIIDPAPIFDLWIDDLSFYRDES